MTDSEDIVVFKDEEGVEHRCMIILISEFDGGVYAALSPVDSLEGEGDLEAFLFEVIEDDEGQTFGYIEDEGRYEAVAAFMSSVLEEGGEAEA